ncbi:hypothetical protein U1Q18_040017 [Sarracenia purpurea var. burkii]
MVAMLACADGQSSFLAKMVMFQVGSTCSLASYILGLEADCAKNRKDAKDTFFSVFSALLDALLLRAQEDQEWGAESLGLRLGTTGEEL